MKFRILAAAALAVAASQHVFTQQTVPFNNGIPIAPSGLAARPLPKLPMDFDTGEDMRIRVVAVATGLANPWSLAFLPDGVILVTEREGRLRVVRNGRLDPQPVAGTPVSYSAGVSGLPGAIHGYMDLALHPQFASNNFVYLSYTKPLNEKQRTVAIARGRWDGTRMVDMRDIFVADVGTGTATRLAFGRDNTLYLTTGG